MQYWPEPGLQQYGPMEVEFLSMSADEDVITRLFRVKNVTRVSHHTLPPRNMAHAIPLRSTSRVMTFSSSEMPQSRLRLVSPTGTGSVWERPDAGPQPVLQTQLEERGKKGNAAHLKAAADGLRACSRSLTQEPLVSIKPFKAFSRNLHQRFYGMGTIETSPSCTR